MKLRLSVEPKFCGPASFGTVELIKVIREHGGFGLGEAKNWIDQAVWEGTEVIIPLPDHADGTNLISRIQSLETPAVIHAQLIP